MLTMPNAPNIVALCDCPCDCTEVVYAGDHPRFSGWCLACQNGRHQPPDVEDPVLIAVHMSAFRQFDWTTCLGHGHTWWQPVHLVRKRGCGCGCGND